MEIEGIAHEQQIVEKNRSSSKLWKVCCPNLMRCNINGPRSKTYFLLAWYELNISGVTRLAYIYFLNNSYGSKYIFPYMAYGWCNADLSSIIMWSLSINIIQKWLMSNIIRPNVLSYAFHTSKAVHTAYTTQNVKGSIFLLQRACTSMRLKEICWAIVSGLIIYAVPRNLHSPTNPYQFN